MDWVLDSWKTTHNMIAQPCHTTGEWRGGCEGICWLLRCFLSLRMKWITHQQYLAIMKVIIWWQITAIILSFVASSITTLIKLSRNANTRLEIKALHWIWEGGGNFAASFVLHYESGAFNEQTHWSPYLENTRCPRISITLFIWSFLNV